MVSQATSLRKDPTRVDPKSCTPDGGWSLPPPPGARQGSGPDLQAATRSALSEAQGGEVGRWG